MIGKKEIFKFYQSALYIFSFRTFFMLEGFMLYNKGHLTEEEKIQHTGDTEYLKEADSSTIQ